MKSFYLLKHSDRLFQIIALILLQVSLLVKTKLMHADKVENGDELVQVGGVSIENLTVAKLMEIMATPNREIEGYGVLLSFKKSNGVVYRFMGETMNLSVDRMPQPIGGHDVGGAEIKAPASAMESTAVIFGQNAGPAVLAGSA